MRNLWSQNLLLVRIFYLYILTFITLLYFKNTEMNKSNKIYTIAIEGLDGVGKTTTANELNKLFIKKGYKSKIISIKDTYCCNMIKLSECNNETKFLLHLVSLFYSIDTEFEKRNHDILIFDRYFYSVLATYNALQNDLRKISKMLIQFPKPDLSILLTCEKVTRKKRLLERNPPPSIRKLSTHNNYGDIIASSLVNYSEMVIIDNEKISVNDTINQIYSKYILTKQRLYV